MPKVTYYKSVICPRCWPVDKRLSELRAAQPDVEIETVEILQHPKRVLKDRVMGIPLLIVGEKRWHHVPSIEELQAALKDAR